MNRFLDFSNLRGDILGGITAGIIALPLALAFGEASGAGPIAGLYGAILVGFFASIFGGTGSQVSGPTGPMVVVFAGVFESMNGNVELVFAAVILAGLLQILFGILKLGDYIKLVPYPVISGFMSGIGVIIIALQAPAIFGYKPNGSGVLGALSVMPEAFKAPNIQALLLGLATTIMVFAWPRTLSKIIPSTLGALVICTSAALFMDRVPVLGNIPTGLPDFIIPQFTQDTALIALEAAFILALLGTIDSLLTSLVADNMTRTRHNSNQELIGQGIGNTLAGFFGAIPGAGATMRTVINIRTGGQTKISGAVHALILLSIVLMFGPLAEKIPHAVLAGILVKVGYDIIDFTYLKRAHKGPRWDLLLMVIVLGLTVFVDLITAVIVGVFLAAMAFVKQIADHEMDLIQTKPHKDFSKTEIDLIEKSNNKIVVFNFSGPLSFGAMADLGHHARLKTKENTEAIILNFERVSFLDTSSTMAIETIISDAQKDKRAILISGANVSIQKSLSQLALKETDFYKTRLQAIKSASQKIER